MTYAHIVTKSSVSIVHIASGKQTTIGADHVKYQDILRAIKNLDFDTALSLADMTATVNEFGNGAVQVRNGQIYYKNLALNNTLTTHILNMIRDGFDVNPMLKFLENLMLNPSERAVQELYGFLEFGKLPITEDGHFLAYKVVRPDYRDIYSGKFDNSVGKICEMDRNKVDDNKDQTCSDGLHFCSLEYLPNYHACTSGNHIMIVKVNPRDVVSIPSDYNNTKARGCRYEVVAEYTGDITKPAFDKSVHSSDGGPYVPKRDARGRFITKEAVVEQPARVTPKRDARGRFISKKKVVKKVVPKVRGKRAKKRFLKRR